MTLPPAALTAGTAGHIDHGKTALVRALTGVDADRLPEERRRGLTIELGFAAMALRDGRQLSLVDVPGHERLVRAMVSGATGIDMFLLAVAADDGPMPQTHEHLRVLRALGVADGIVAITKADRADPGPAAEAVRALLPDAAVVACSARTGAGVDAVAVALADVAETVRPRGVVTEAQPPVLHVDRVFTIRGAGTVVTGTLWSGAVSVGDRLRLLPADREVRVRGVQVHDRPQERADAGQRVAINLARVDRDELVRGDVLTALEGGPVAAFRLQAALELAPEAEIDGARVQVHHGTRSVPARVRAQGGDGWRLTLEQPLVAAPGDRLVVRRIAPADTLGGGVVTAVGSARRAERTETSRGPSPAGGASAPATGPLARSAAPSGVSDEPPLLDAHELALEARLREAGLTPPDERDLGEDAARLPALRAAGRAVRVGRSMHAHPDAIAQLRTVVEATISRDGHVTLAGLRDELGTSRKYAQALLEHLDATRVTRRLPDDRRVLRARR